MPHIREMFPRKYLSMHDFAEGERVIVTVKSVQLESVQMRPGGFGRPAQAQDPKWLVFFHEYPKPMPLRPGRAAKLVAALGSEKSEDWVGKRLEIYRGFTDIAGDVVEGLLINTMPVPQLPPPKPAPQLVTADRRPIPRDAVDRFIAAMKQHGKNWEAFLGWCRGRSPEALALLYGADFDNIPGGAMPAMKAFLDELAAPAQAEVIDRSTGEVLTPAASAAAGRPPVVPNSHPPLRAPSPVREDDPGIEEKDIPF